MSHSLHQGVTARLYVKFWEQMELIDYNIFQHKHPIIWGAFFLFTITLPLSPFAVGVAGLVLGFVFSRYLDKKGYFMDKKFERLKEEEIKVELRLKEIEAKERELGIDERVVELEFRKAETHSKMEMLNKPADIWDNPEKIY